MIGKQKINENLKKFLIIVVCLLIIVATLQTIRIKKEEKLSSERPQFLIGEATTVVTKIQGTVDKRSNQSITVELYNSENIKKAETLVNDIGGFEFSIAETGSYYIKVNQEGYLQYECELIEIFDGNIVTLEAISMEFGDLNADNQIEIQDLIELGQNFKMLATEEVSKYNSNGDLKINEEDRENLKSNYGKIKEISVAKYTTKNSTLATEVKIGDYVDYNPITTQEYELNRIYTGQPTKIVTREDLKWRVLSKDETTGKVKLIADTSTTQIVDLGDAVGYNNAVYLLNDMCDKLYSKSGVGTARSINIEDIEERSTYDPTSQPEYGTIVTPKGKYCPAIYQYEKGRNGVTTGIDENDTGSTVMEMPTTQAGVSYGFTSACNTEKSYDVTTYIKETIFRELLLTNKRYWLASRGVQVGPYYATFFVRVMVYGGMGTCSLYDSYGDLDSYSHGVMPIVSLVSNIQTTGKNESGEWILAE